MWKRRCPELVKEDCFIPIFCKASGEVDPNEEIEKASCPPHNNNEFNRILESSSEDDGSGEEPEVSHEEISEAVEKVENAIKLPEADQPTLGTAFDFSSSLYDASQLIQMIKDLKTPNDHDPMNVLKLNVLYNVRVEEVISPANFYMKFILESPHDDECETWDKCLQLFYGDKANSELYKMRTLVPMNGRVYAVYDKESGKWERMRVIDVDHARGTVQVKYLDYFNRIAEVETDSLYELHPRYGNWPSHSIKGRLKGIIPLSSSTDPPVPSFYDWSAEAIQYFKRVTENKLLNVFIVDMETVFDHQEKITKASVFLLDPDYDVPLNLRLIQKGYAVSFDLWENWNELLEVLHGENPEIPD